MKSLSRSLLTGLSLLLMFSLSRAAEFPDMTLQIAHVNPRSPDDQYDKYAMLFSEKVTERTGGKVKFDIYGSAQLGGERDVIEGLGLGTVDISIMSNLATAAVNDPSCIIELPFFFRNREQMYAFLDSDLNKEISETVYQNLNAKILAWGEGGYRHVINNIRPIRVPDDFKGIKIRVPESPMFVDTFKALGANPTPISFTETFTAIQQGTADGLELPIMSIYTTRFYEICKYMSMTRHFYNANCVMVSRMLWESLSPELQEIFVQAAKEAGQEQRIFVQQNELRQVEDMGKAGIAINDDVDFDAMQKAVRPLYEKYRGIIGEDTFERAMKMLRD